VLSYRGDSFHRIRERNLEHLQRAQDENRLRVLLRSAVHQITSSEVVLSLPEQRMTLANDYVFVLIGGEPPESFLQRTGVQIVEKRLGA